MITQHNQSRGRPRGKKAPASSTSRVNKFRKNLKEAGGISLTIYLDAEELRKIEHIKEKLNLPIKTSRSEVIKAITCILGGGAYFTTGHQVTATVEITERTLHPD